MYTFNKIKFPINLEGFFKSLSNISMGDDMKMCIEELIKESGLKKRYIADTIGVNENTLTNWIMGRSWPRLNQAIILAKILRCDIDDLYTDIGVKKDG